jgi:hypothetical protein
LGYSACTGVLVHPEWVLTAGHCVIDGEPVSVTVGLVSFDELGGGETRDGLASRRVRKAVMHPKYPRNQFGHDIALVRLDEPVTDIAPRVIANDCIIAEDLYEGAPVDVVGWGATRKDGSGSTYTLQQGVTEIQTPDCEESRVNGIISGCDPNARPGGELGAGGNGVDACFGDSGGPLYLPTDRGTYLVGITSRSYIGVPNDEPCAYGGIYTRPDSVFEWIEDTIGEPLPRPTCTLPPVALAEPVNARPNKSAKVDLEVTDADGASWTVEVKTPPSHGTIEIDGQDVRYKSATDYEGPDSFELRITDDGNAAWPGTPGATADVLVPVEVAKGLSCGGCDGSGGARGLGAALGLGLIGLRRRRVAR